MDAIDTATRAIDELTTERGDLVDLQRRIIGQLRTLIPFDWYGWVTTDPATTVGALSLGELPEGVDLAESTRLRYLTPVTRWTAIPQGEARRLMASTGDHPEASAQWRDLLSRFHVRDQLSIVFADNRGTWGFLELFRQGIDFTAAEQALAASFSAQVVAMIRRIHGESFRFGVTTPHVYPEVSHNENATYLRYSSSLEYLGASGGHERWMQVAAPGEAGRALVADAGMHAAAQLLARDARVDNHPASTRVHVGDGEWAELEATWAGESDDGSRDILVTMRSATPDERLDLIVATFGLSAREREIIRRAVLGDDQRAIARAIGISEHTVKDHSAHIMQRMGTGSRAEVVAMVLGKWASEAERRRNQQLGGFSI